MIDLGMSKLSLLLLKGIYLDRSIKLSRLTDEQMKILRFAFRLRIEQFKSGKLNLDFYVESGKFHDDLEDAKIDSSMDAETFQAVDMILKDEFKKANFNPTPYEL